jgi:hypothetical protein
MAKATLTIQERLFKLSVPEPNTGCILWIGGVGNKGYGRVRYNGKTCSPHRVAYELKYGKIPDGLQLDHLCRITCCINPDHLEPVTCKENINRAPWANQIQCVNGHIYPEGNPYSPVGRHKKICGVCALEYQRRYRAKKRQ